MAHFAKINSNDVVVQVIVAEQDFIDSGAVGDPSRWIQTSYNTKANVHGLGGTPLRKNFAGIGYLYNRELDAFTPPKPYHSWILNTETGQWDSPVPYPDENLIYSWDETNQQWILV